MIWYGNSNVIETVRAFVLLLGLSGLISGGQARAAGTESSQGGRFRYVRIFSAAVDEGLNKTLGELEAIARENGTEEVAMFLPSDGPEVQAGRWILREGSEEHTYPGVTVKARTHLTRLKEKGALEISKDARKATGVLAKENARVEWTLPETIHSPLLCDIYEGRELLAANTIHERLSPSGHQRWPDVIRIDVPGRKCSIIQVFEYLEKRPEELSSVEDEYDFVRKRPPDDLPAEKIAPRPDKAGEEKTLALEGEEVEKRGPVSFSDALTGLPSMDFDTGWKPSGSPLQTRFTAGAGADISASVWGEFVLSYTDINSGDANLTLPDNNSGGGNLSMDFGVEMSTRGRVNVDLKFDDIDHKFDIPYAPNFDLRCQDSTLFDSYLLSGSSPSYVEVRDGIDTQELYSVSLAGIKGIVDISIGVYADMEAWIGMSAYSLSTDSSGEHSEFSSEGQTLVVTLGSGGTYDAEVDYNEDLDVGITVNFYPALCAEIDTYIYSWDYCVSGFKLPVNIDLGTIDLNLSSTVQFEKTYDLMIIDGIGGTTNPLGGIYSSNEPWTETVELNEIEVNYDFDHWLDHWVDSCGVGGSITIAEVNCTVTMDESTPWHTLYPAFFYATAATPFPGDGTDKIGDKAILSWRAGERADLHHVYFGTSFSDVNDRSGGVDQGVWDSAEYDTSSYDANLGRCKTYYWRVDEVNDSYSGAGAPPWTSNVVWRFISVGCRASEPMPADGHDDAPTRGLVRWAPGACVNDVSGHDVYFGTSYYGVESATTSSAEYMGHYDSCSFDTDDYDSSGLEIDRTYYWRVDEINDSYAYVGPPDRPHWKGDVWSFTAGHIPVDNFEDYSDTVDLHSVWQEPNATGADIYLETYAHYVQEGLQSMRYDYDNFAGGWYSMVVADTYDLRCGSDWTAQGAKALVVYFYGDGDNDPCEQMWVGLQDGSYKSGFLECEADANDANEWNVDLNDFNNFYVDLTDVKKVFICFGDRGITPVAGGTGTVWFDEIRLYPARCRPEHSRPAGDIASGDCMVNLMDFSIMGRDWLDMDSHLEATAPADVNMIVKYTFDAGDLSDSAGPPYYDGCDVNTVSLHDGILTLDGNNFVEIPFGGDNRFDGSNDFSIAIQFRTMNPGVLISSADGNEPNAPEKHSMAIFVTDWGSGNGAVLYGNFWLGTISEVNNPLDGNWHHAVVTYDSNSGLHRLYLDGITGSEGIWKPNIPDIANDVVRIGGSLNTQFPEPVNTAGDFVGDINSVEIYDYTLSPEEVCYLSNEAKGYPAPDIKPCYQPLRSPANLVRDANDCEDPNIFDPNSFDPNCPDIVDFRDVDKMVENWLELKLWPEH